MRTGGRPDEPAHPGIDRSDSGSAGRWKAEWNNDTRNRIRRLLAEFLGTGGLCFLLGAGAADLAGAPPWALIPLLAAASGLWLAAAIYFLGGISAHFNPAVTLAFAVRREMEVGMAIAYFLCQFVAAASGSLLARAFVGTKGQLGRVTPPPNHDWQAMSWELVLTCGLVLVVLGIANGPKLNQLFMPIAIFAYITAFASVGGSYDGAAMNPARAFGPALATGHLANLWPYLIGGTLGALVAVAIAQVFRSLATT
jgi:glycerol uptake facilitator-like aquaporin